MDRERAPSDLEAAWLALIPRIGCKQCADEYCGDCDTALHRMERAVYAALRGARPPGEPPSADVDAAMSALVRAAEMHTETGVGEMAIIAAGKQLRDVALRGPRPGDAEPGDEEVVTLTLAVMDAEFPNPGSFDRKQALERHVERVVRATLRALRSAHPAASPARAAAAPFAAAGGEPSDGPYICLTCGTDMGDGGSRFCDPSCEANYEPPSGGESER
jgi:hypothetical protein